MFGITKKELRKLNVALHRDLGYFFSTLIVIYCISGIALNHVDDWNSDFIITKDSVTISRSYTINEINQNVVKEFSAMVKEEDYKIFDFP